MLQARSPFSLVLFIARSSCLLFSPSSLARSAASFLRVSSPAAFSTDSPYSYLLLFRSHATPHRVEEVAGLNYGEYSYYPLAFPFSLSLSSFLSFIRPVVLSYHGRHEENARAAESRLFNFRHTSDMFRRMRAKRREISVLSILV